MGMRMMVVFDIYNEVEFLQIKEGRRKQPPKQITRLDRNQRNM